MTRCLKFWTCCVQHLCPYQSIGFCLQFIVYKPELQREVISFRGERNICQRLFWSIHRNNIPSEHCNRCLQFQTRTLENNCSQVTNSTLKKATIIFRGNHRSKERRYLNIKFVPVASTK